MEEDEITTRKNASGTQSVHRIKAPPKYHFPPSPFSLPSFFSSLPSLFPLYPIHSKILNKNMGDHLLYFIFFFFPSSSSLFLPFYINFPLFAQNQFTYLISSIFYYFSNFFSPNYM
ncbi:unnamed protein product [Cuscuta europaea]|uniref:Transmembrane protein n=1 Tax=Cuscuta europaea TaxID=41803 RepID=A0A9P0YVA5_CUSEU|nr:unnamed protein product [Cuscuta europaea]